MEYFFRLLGIYATIFMLVTSQAYAGFFGFGKKAATKEVTITSNSLIQAVESGDNRLAQHLLKQGMSANSADSKGISVLSKAAARGNSNMVRTLIRHGANVNSRNHLNETALHYAASNGHENVVRTLLLHGADSSVISKKGYTALDYAMAERYTNIVNLMQNQGAIAVGGTVAAAEGATAGGISTKTILIGAGVVAAAGGAAAALGGGGSGGGPPAPFVPVEPEVFETTEYNSQYGLGNINASFPYSRGYTGIGVTVAVLDTGVDLTHTDINANILSSGQDFINVDNDASDDQGHGTHVAGIIAAEKNDDGMHGVAYNARILPVKVLDNSAPAGSGTYEQISDGIAYAVAQNADIINMSLGGSAPAAVLETAITNAITAGAILVAATGNDGAAEPSYPARYAATLNSGTPDVDLTDPDQGAIIAVGAVDADNTHASYSNDCGSASQWCLVAPGTNIVSLQNGGGTVTFSGTSMATPHVAGAAAVVQQSAIDNGQNLSGQTIAEILLTSATDLGTAGVDTTFGHGLLNLQAALSPLGVTSVPTSTSVGGSSIPFAGSKVVSTTAFGDALSRQNFSMMYLDSYERAYTVDFATISRDNINLMDTTERFEDFANDYFKDTVSLGDDSSLSMSPIRIRDPELPENQGQESTRMSLVTNHDNTQFTLHYNSSVAHAFGVEALQSNASTINEHAFANPYLAMIDEGNGATIGYQLDKHTHVKLASFYGSMLENNHMMSGFASEFSYQNDNSHFSLQSGMMMEENTLLGSTMDGAFAVEGNTPSWFNTVAFNYQLASNLSLFGMASHALTFPNDSNSSALYGITNLSSSAFSAGIERQQLWHKSDSLGFILSQPLRVDNGNASLTLPTARDFDGNVFQNNYAINFAPSGREVNAEVFYSRRFNHNATLQGAALYRHEPNHVEDAPAEGIFMVKYALEF